MSSSLPIIIAGGALVFVIAVGVPTFELVRYWLRERRHRTIDERRNKRRDKIDKVWKETLAAKHAKSEEVKSGQESPPGT